MAEQLISKIKESLEAYTKELNGSLEKTEKGDMKNYEYVLKDLKVERDITSAIVRVCLSRVNEPYEVFVDKKSVEEEIRRRLKPLFKEMPIYADFMK